ncbi:MAG: YggS family pyridoxal phosphate-dependent enzyme [Christensenellales bacterium]
MTEGYETARLRERVADVRLRMAAAAAAAGRRPGEVLLCAACKTRTSQLVRLSAGLPIDLFGENRVQEMLLHQQEDAYLGKPCHFIGHLQTNKVAKVVGRVELIQSVDSLRLLEAIAVQAADLGILQELLFEVNLAGERSKSGVARDALWQLLDAAMAMKSVRVRGLMAIPPADDSDAAARQHFAALRRLLEQASGRCSDALQMDTLSMGMTDSFEAAILEGATLIRVGTGIYGERVKAQ